MSQIRKSEKITVAKYPKAEGWRLVWLFDHSSCHAAMPDDALDVTKMNVNPGGKQRVIYERWVLGWKATENELCSGIPRVCESF